jgi:hypothetical protein
MSGFSRIDSWSTSPVSTDGFAAGLSMGMLEAKRGGLLRALQLRFSAVTPAEVAATIREMDDLDRLDRWIDHALTASSLESFLTHVGASDAMARNGSRR